jgi:hypothetical protein
VNERDGKISERERETEQIDSEGREREGKAYIPPEQIMESFLLL